MGVDAGKVNGNTGNIGIGYNALTANTTGIFNTAIGYNALKSTTTNGNNTAIGYNCLALCTNSNNTGCGGGSMQSLTTGTFNSCFGTASFPLGTTGSFNTCMGVNSMANATLSSNNVCIGHAAGSSITTSVGGNVCIGKNSALQLSTGSNIIAIGNGGGGVVSTGTNGIYIGLNASSGSESNVCRINYIYGITTINASGLTVLVDNGGQLGTVSSTRDTKQNIITIDETENSNIINSLIPRRFDFIKSVGEHQSYGLIYDEVIDICPDICAKNVDGSPLTIYYQHIPILLLTEIQRMNKVIGNMNIELSDLKNRIAILEGV